MDAGQLSPKAVARSVAARRPRCIRGSGSREDSVHGLPGSGHMEPDMEYQRSLEKGNDCLENEGGFDTGKTETPITSVMPDNRKPTSEFSKG